MPFDVLTFAIWIALGMLALSFLCLVVRLVRGPSLPDRVVALDLIAYHSIAFIALVTLRTGLDAYLDVAVTLALIAFLATLAFARYVERMGVEAPGAPADADHLA